MEEYSFGMIKNQIKMRQLFAESKYSRKFAWNSNHKCSPAFESQSKTNIHNNNVFFQKGKISLKRLFIIL